MIKTLLIIMLFTLCVVCTSVSANNVTDIPSNNNVTNSSSSSSTTGNTTTNTTTTDDEQNKNEDNKVSTNEKGYIIAEIYVVNNATGLGLGYTPPESGGIGELLNVAKDYSNCSYEMIVPNNYGKTIHTDLGTFTYKEKTQYDYRYTCPVTPKDITSKSGEFDLIFTATNIETNKVETLDAWFLFYKIGFKSNANLKVGNTDFIVNGKVEKDVVFMNENSDGKAVYDESRNRLWLYNYTGTITYSNMGDTFKIEKDGNCNVEVICNDSKAPVTLADSSTDIKLSANNGVLPENTQMVVSKVSKGSTYMLVENTLKDITSKLYIYDITLTSAGTKVQPNGKVKISIPVPSDVDTSKLTVYRVADNGEKTEYKVTVEGGYATFETDHFSTYVLAEKTATSQEENKQHILDNEPKTGIMNTVIIAGIVLSISAVGYIICRKKMYK